MPPTNTRVAPETRRRWLPAMQASDPPGEMPRFGSRKRPSCDLSAVAAARVAGLAFFCRPRSCLA